MKSQQARAAKQLKQELKAEFPDVKFSVTSESFSMGDAVRVSWTDGVTSQQVKQIADKYQKGTFDGMRDLYEYDSVDEDLPQAKYVTVSRSMSDETRQQILGELKDAFGIDRDLKLYDRPDEFGGMEVRTKIHREFSDTDFTADKAEA